MCFGVLLEMVLSMEKAMQADTVKMGASGRSFLEKNYSANRCYQIIMKHFE